MKKIAIVVEPDFTSKHVGVRNLIFSLYKELESISCNVEFIYFSNVAGTVHWYRYHIDDEYIYNNYALDDKIHSGTPNEVLSSWKRDRFSSNISAQPTNAYKLTAIGNNIEKEKFDLFILSVPWLNYIDAEIHSKPTIGIVYDMIPNDYVINNTAKPFHFASLHLAGYRYFNNHCKKVLCISKATESRYLEYFKEASDKTLVMPPAIPNYLRSQCFPGSSVKEKNIILAGPFDPRKGLLYLPDLLNRVSESFDKLYIYGKQRCSDIDFETFFSNLNKEDVIWYETISSDKLSELYRNSSLLIFPSDDEGLGLPIIESQLLGCDVITTKFDSAREIIVNENNPYLCLDLELDEIEVKNMLERDNTTKSDQVASLASDYFSNEKYTEFYKILIHQIKEATY
ncbi:hypothetical protein A9266_21005 [Vibrio tasmaniensis]|nr:hypothetical protein A9266_21005 [Vibrio tasmaniensis]